MSNENGRSGAEWRAIIERLAQIEALIENGATQGEAEAAAAAFTRTLTRFNLSEDEYRSRRGGYDPNGYERFVIVIDDRVDWARKLLYVIAKHNGCDMIVYTGSLAVSVVGVPETVELVRKLYEAFRAIARSCCLTVSRERLSQAMILRYGSKKWQASYLAGFADGIGAAMREARKKAVAETENGSALVVLQQNALAQAVERLIGETEPIERATVITSAYDRGVADGRAAYGEKKAIRAGGA